MKSLLRKLLSTESEWNPKVMLGRVIVHVFPDRALHRIKKAYYGYLITHTPEDWIERDAMMVKNIVAPGDIVLDIGANLGVFTRFLSHLIGPDAMVYAFEPIPQTFEFLTHNLYNKLALTNVTAFDYALSDVNQEQTMVIPRYRWGSECWYDARMETRKSKPEWRRITVKSRRLDDVFLPLRPNDRIAFIKCDANFHELAVLRGARATIRKHHPAMLIEVNPDPDNPSTTAYQTFEFLRGEGYLPYCFDGKTLQPRAKGIRSQNYFFLTAEQYRRIVQNEVPCCHDSRATA